MKLRCTECSLHNCFEMIRLNVLRESMLCQISRLITCARWISTICYLFWTDVSAFNNTIDVKMLESQVQLVAPFSDISTVELGHAFHGSQ